MMVATDAQSIHYHNTVHLQTLLGHPETRMARRLWGLISSTANQDTHFEGRIEEVKIKRRKLAL